MEEFARKQLPPAVKLEWIERQPFGNEAIERVLLVTLRAE